MSETQYKAFKGISEDGDDQSARGASGGARGGRGGRRKSGQGRVTGVKEELEDDELEGDLSDLGGMSEYDVAT